RAPAARAPSPAKKAPAAPAAKKDDDEDFDLFGSDDEEEDAEKAALVEARLKEYHAKKAAKPKTIAKSMVILDVKPWDDETDMKAMEANVRGIVMDGLVWGTAKLVAIGYGIKKLQITAVVEDDKVGVDDLSDQITAFEDFVQSVDVASFNKLVFAENLVMSTIPIEKYKNVKHKLREVLEENEFLISKLWKFRTQLMAVERERDNLLHRLKKGTGGSAIGSMDISDSEEEATSGFIPRGRPAAIPPPVVISSTAAPTSSTTTVTKKEKETRKRKPVTSKTLRIQKYEIDESTGKPILPLSAGAMTIVSLGDIVYDRPAYHSERYIYPVGFTSVKVYLSMLDKEKSVHYTCEIKDGGDSPKFIVTPEDCPERSVTALSATGAWMPILKAANELRNKTFTSGLSGPDFFGLTNGIVTKVLQELPNARLCKSYVWQEFEFVQARGGGAKRSIKSEDGGSSHPAKKAKLALETQSSTTSIDSGLVHAVSADSMDASRFDSAPQPFIPSVQPSSVDFEDDDLDAEDERDETDAPAAVTNEPSYSGQQTGNHDGPETHPAAQLSQYGNFGGKQPRSAHLESSAHQLHSDQSSNYDST
ncbi:hypothetical protein HDU81_010727, partial [Chytriomyces hyalinus]